MGVSPVQSGAIKNGNNTALSSYTVRQGDQLAAILINKFKMTANQAYNHIAQLKRKGENVDLIRPGDVINNPSQNPDKVTIERRSNGALVKDAIKDTVTLSQGLTNTDIKKMTKDKNSPLSVLTERLKFIHREDLARRITSATSQGDLLKVLDDINALNLDADTTSTVVIVITTRAGDISQNQHDVIGVICLRKSPSETEKKAALQIGLDQANNSTLLNERIDATVSRLPEGVQAVTSVKIRPVMAAKVLIDARTAAGVIELDTKFNIGLDAGTRAKLACVAAAGGIKVALTDADKELAGNWVDRILAIAMSHNNDGHDVVMAVIKERNEAFRAIDKAVAEKAEAARLEEKRNKDKAKDDQVNERQNNDRKADDVALQPKADPADIRRANLRKIQDGRHPLA